MYSSSGIAPALSSERNSYYAQKQTNPGDGGSVRSNVHGHGRTDSITRSIGGLTNADSPVASPRDMQEKGKISRRNSDFTEVNEEDVDLDRARSSTSRLGWAPVAAIRSFEGDCLDRKRRSGRFRVGQLSMLCLYTPASWHLDVVGYAL